MVSWKGYGPQIQPLGCVVKDKGGLEFGLWAPHAKTIEVVFSNGRRFPLVGSGKPEIWKCAIEKENQWRIPDDPTPVTYHFEIDSSWNDCFITEGAILHRRDPYARLTEFETNECFVPVWESIKLCPDSPFFDSMDVRPKWPNCALNIFELHVGSFGPADGSCFARIPLDHISSLGFNTIELMPVQEFGGSWGYNPRLLMAIHPFFGTPCDLKKFVTACHKKEMKVILDLVLNHGSARRNSLWNFDGYGQNNNGGIYFQHGKETGWGRQFNFEAAQVLHYIRDTCKYFLETMNVDGLRFDSVHNMQYRFTKDLLFELKRDYSDRVFIAEVTPEDPRVCRDQHFDAVWIHADYYDAVKLFKERGNEWDAKLVCNIFNGHAHFASGLEMIASGLGSHDQIGNRNKGHSDDWRIGRYMIDLLGGRNNWHARAKIRMLFSLQALGRQIPMIFQGTEILQDEWWNVDEHHHWKRSLVDNRDCFTMQFMNMVKAVNQVRVSSIALQAVEQAVQTCHVDHHNLVLGFVRALGGDDFLVIVNWGEGQWENPLTYGVHTPWPNRSIRPLFNSQAQEFGGWDSSWPSGLTSDGSRSSLRIEDSGVLNIPLPKWSTLLFRLEL